MLNLKAPNLHQTSIITYDNQILMNPLFFLFGNICCYSIGRIKEGILLERTENTRTEVEKLYSYRTKIRKNKTTLKKIVRVY